jgi:uncharacterized protein YkwD
LKKPSFCAAVAAMSLGLALACCAGPPPQLSREGAARLEPVDQTQAQAMISRYRRAHGLFAVRIDPVLERAAESQALAMASTSTLSHTVAGSLAQRLSNAGLPATAADENVSGGYFSLDAALAGWRKSPPHDRNLLDPHMRRIGIGSAYAAGARYKQYWSLILAD